MEFKDHLKSQVDIAVVVAEIRASAAYQANRLTGLCPFPTRRPHRFPFTRIASILSATDARRAAMFSNFVMQIEGLSFYEALKKLAEQNGIPLPKQSLASDDRHKLRAASNENARNRADHFRDNLAATMRSNARLSQTTRSRRENPFAHSARPRGISASAWSVSLIAADF